MESKLFLIWEQIWASLLGSFDGSNDINIEGLLIEDSLGSIDGKVLGYDEGKKLGISDGKMLGTIIGIVYGITLGLDV